MPLIWGSLKEQGLSDEAAEIIYQSWRHGTTKQYRPYLRQWERYCRKRNSHSVSIHVTTGINFLQELYQKGLSHSAINTARSALSSVIQPTNSVSFGSHPLVTRYLKGVFNTRPSFPRYKQVWDVTIVLKFLKSLDPLDSLSLKDLTLKTTMLLALLSGQRCQTL